MDILDQADALVEHTIQVALKNQRAEAEELEKGLKVLQGNCLYCREELKEAGRFCDTFCQEDFELLSRAHRQRVRQ
jgi:hypothetical protein